MPLPLIWLQHQEEGDFFMEEKEFNASRIIDIDGIPESKNKKVIPTIKGNLFINIKLTNKFLEYTNEESATPKCSKIDKKKVHFLPEVSIRIFDLLYKKFGGWTWHLKDPRSNCHTSRVMYTYGLTLSNQFVETSLPLESMASIQDMRTSKPKRWDKLEKRDYFQTLSPSSPIDIHWTRKYPFIN
jgi:hypothetical protein